jgi:hypothetical protein
MNLQDLRFSYQYCWRFKSSGFVTLCHCVSGSPKILKECGASTFMVERCKKTSVQYDPSKHLELLAPSDIASRIRRPESSYCHFTVNKLHFCWLNPTVSSTFWKMNLLTYNWKKVRSVVQESPTQWPMGEVNTVSVTCMWWLINGEFDIQQTVHRNVFL